MYGTRQSQRRGNHLWLPTPVVAMAGHRGLPRPFILIRGGHGGLAWGGHGGFAPTRMAAS